MPDLQDQILISYFLYLKETVEDEKKRNEKIIKAVNDYYLGRD